MATPVNEQYIAELTRSIGAAYMAVKRGIGSNTKPGTALFDLAQLSSLSSNNLPKFGLLETEVTSNVLPFEVSYNLNNSNFITVGAGFVGYNFNNTPQKILVYTQDIPIKRAFSSYYDTNYRYGVRLGLPLSEVQKSVQSYNTSLSSAVSPGDQYISLSDLTIADQLGFPLKATIGNIFVTFSDFSSDKTKLKIDPSFNNGNGFPGSATMPVATRVYFIYEPRILSVVGLPVSTSLVDTIDPAAFPYMPPIPSSWLPIADFVVTNPLSPTLGTQPNILRTTTMWPDPTALNSTPVFGSKDAITINKAALSASGSLVALLGSASVGEAIRALEDYTAELSGTNNISFRQYWASRPFVGTSYFTHGVSFANIERFEFSDEFAEAYYDATQRDVQHTFAIFRGDAYASGSATITPTLSPPPKINLRSMTTTAIDSSFTRGSYIYGVSAVYTTGESTPVYGTIVTNPSNTYYINDIQFDAATPAPLFYNVYRRSSLVGDVQEWRLTQPYDITKPSQWDKNLIDTTISSSSAMSHLQEAIKFTVTESSGCVGGIGILLKTPNGALTNATGNHLSVSLYSNATNLPGSKIADASVNAVIPYNSLKQGFKLFIVNFDKPLPVLTQGSSYWIVITQSASPTGDTIVFGKWSGNRTTINDVTDSTGTSGHAYYSSGAWHVGDGDQRYYQLYGLIDNNLPGYSLSHRGLFITNKKALVPARLRVYVPPIDPTTIMVGRVPGVQNGDENNVALGAVDTNTNTVNDLIVTVVAKNSIKKTKQTFTVTVPKNTARDTSFLLGSSNDLFDSIDDVQVVPGTNTARGPSGAIAWSIYDLITVETSP